MGATTLTQLYLHYTFVTPCRQDEINTNRAGSGYIFPRRRENVEDIHQFWSGSQKRGIFIVFIFLRFPTNSKHWWKPFVWAIILILFSPVGLNEYAKPSTTLKLGNCNLKRQTHKLRSFGDPKTFPVVLWCIFDPSLRSCPSVWDQIDSICKLDAWCMHESIHGN